MPNTVTFHDYDESTATLQSRAILNEPLANAMLELVAGLLPPVAGEDKDTAR